MNVTCHLKRAVFIYAIFLSALAQIAAQGNSSYLRQALISETTQAVHIRANSPRPLLQTLDALRHRYGWVVNYEDPAYTMIESRDDPSHFLIPAGGDFNVEFPVRSPLEDQTLRLIVDAYNQSSNPGRFELRRTAEGGFYVVGIFARNQAYAMPRQSLLDTPVTLSPRQRTVSDTINLLCQALAMQNHTSVSVGIVPRALVANTRVQIGGGAVSARQLLMQSLQATRQTLYWCLFFDPASKGYVLNVHTAKS